MAASRLTDSVLGTIVKHHVSDRALLDENSFKQAIALERKRAERSRRLFLLMLLDLPAVLTSEKNRRSVSEIMKALSTSIRETDVIGWHETNVVLGIIFTDIQQELRNSIVSTTLLKIRGLLYRDLPFDEFNRIGISCHVFPEEWDHDVPQRPSSPVLYPDISKHEDGSKVFSTIKRTIDMTGSALGLLLGFPLLLLIGLAIKLTSNGPVLFRQVRVGQYGKPFVFLKFRSMFVDNDPAIHKDYVIALIHGRAERSPQNSANQGIYKLTKDRRVTPVGAFLRKTSLDELPQLYNVLVGDMSLVGPRPAIPYEVKAYQVWHRRRVLEAKPGITGLWQVKGRSRVTFDEMVRLDVRYAMARSLWLDLKILMATPRAVLMGAGAC